MKSALFLIFIFLFNIYFSQNNIIEYEFFHYENKEYSEYLASNQTVSYYFTYGGANYRGDKTDYKTIMENFDVKKFSPTIIKKNKLLYSKFSLPKKSYYAVENTPEIIWKITNETKDILGYHSRKATTTFRGRDYIVWFTTEIADSNGPWKLGGLSGLILEAGDSKNAYKYLVKSVIVNTKLWIPEEALLIADKKISTSVPFKDAISEQNIRLQNWINEALASQPTRTNMIASPLRSEMRETTFEWENQPTKP